MLPVKVNSIDQMSILILSYPDAEQAELRKLLQGYIGVGAEHIVAGSGSGDLIDLVLRLLVQRILSIHSSMSLERGSQSYPTWEKSVRVESTLLSHRT